MYMLNFKEKEEKGCTWKKTMYRYLKVEEQRQDKICGLEKN